MARCKQWNNETLMNDKNNKTNIIKNKCTILYTITNWGVHPSYITGEEWLKKLILFLNNNFNTSCNNINIIFKYIISSPYFNIQLHSKYIEILIYSSICTCNTEYEHNLHLMLMNRFNKIKNYK